MLLEIWIYNLIRSVLKCKTIGAAHSTINNPYIEYVSIENVLSPICFVPNVKNSI